MSSEVSKEYLWNDVSLSLRLSERGECGFVWLGGLRSDMSGTKADVLVDQAAKLGVSSLRFDYSGHGVSSGKFEDYCISDWLDQSLQIIPSPYAWSTNISRFLDGRLASIAL